MESKYFLDNSNRLARKLSRAEGLRLTKAPACYIIENKETGNIYVGSTKNISSRLSSHRYHLEAGRHPNVNLLREYESCVDKDNFIIHISMYDNVEEARNREQDILDEGHGHECLLNISNNARSPSSGYDRSSALEKLIAAIRTPEHRSKVSAESAERWKDPYLRNKMLDSMGDNVVVDGVFYRSIREASRETKVCVKTIKDRLVNGTCTLDDVQPATKKVSVKGVIYSSVSEAAQANGVALNTMTWRCQNNSDKWKDHYYIVN